jgi:hypothetical protein
MNNTLRANGGKEVWYVATKVDNDIPISDESFHKKVVQTLSKPRGWQSIDNIEFRFVSWNTLNHIKSRNKIPVRLSANETIVKECGFKELERLSCCNTITKQVWLNYYRWKNGAKPSKLTLDRYRNYMINHEIGHALGRLHAKCPCEGCSAPIMMQHTITIGKCKPNDKPLANE